MLKEIISNIPIAGQFTMSELQEILMQDFVALVRESVKIDVMKNSDTLTSADIEKIVVVIRQVYEKIFESRVVNPEMKIFIANSLLCRLYELWKISSTPELFFIKIRKEFSPAQIVAALELFMSVPTNQTWALNFFCEHKEIFPRKQGKIRTIALYYFRMYSGGVERFLSTIIPIYIQLGYRVVLFTDEYKPELEYPLPTPSNNFFRIILKSHGQTLKRLNEIGNYFKEYNIDLFFSHQHWDSIPPVLQILFTKFCGIKMMMQFHEGLHRFAFEFNYIYIYSMTDSLITLSYMRKEFWKNYNVRSYYVPNPTQIDNAKKFHGRDPRKITNTIIYVGRIAEDKNTFPIILILNEVVKIIPNVKLKIVGEIFQENVFNRMQKFIAENHLENNVEFLGYHTDVAPFYESADVILNTSPSEGWSLVIAESKFYELPLVLYELDDNELLRDGKGYVSVPQGDFKAAARAVVKILTDTEFRCKLSAEARESIQPFLDYDFAGAWKKIFDDIENDLPVPPHNVENEKIQTFLIKEIWKQRAQTQAVIAHFQNLIKR